MIEVERTITIKNDGSEWTLTTAEANDLQNKLTMFLMPESQRFPPTFFQQQSLGVGLDQSVSTGNGAQSR